MTRSFLRVPRRMRLKPQQQIRVLNIGFGLVVILLAVVVVFGFTRMEAITQGLNEIVYGHNVHINHAHTMYRLARERTVLLQKITVEKDRFVQDEYVQRHAALAGEFSDAHRRLMRLRLKPRDMKLLTEIADSARRSSIVHEQVVDLALYGKQSDAQSLMLNQAIPLQDQVTAQLLELTQLQNEATRRSVDLAQHAERAGRLMLLGAGSVALLLAVGIALYVRQRMLNLTINLESLVADRTQEIEEGAEMMERITSAALDAIVMIDDDGKVIFWNHAAETVFGHSQNEALGSNLHQLIMPPRYQAQQAAAFSRYLKSGQGEYIGQTREVEAVHRDGHEFPLELSLSAVRIKNRWVGIGIGRDITERKQAEEILHQLASTDALTGLANRRSFDVKLEAETRRVERYPTPLSLTLFDIDHFKSINDTHGHLVGDQVLKELAQLVSGNIRGTDILARWGGEEFVILSPNTDQDAMLVLAEKLRRSIEQHAFPVVGRVTCSFGLTKFSPGETIPDFVDRADVALYTAKAKGRNRVKQL